MSGRHSVKMTSDEETDALAARVLKRAGGDPYTVLGVPRRSPRARCRAAFNALSRRLHGDNCDHPQATEALSIVVKAWRDMQDDLRRKKTVKKTPAKKTKTKMNGHAAPPPAPRKKTTVRRRRVPHAHPLEPLPLDFDATVDEPKPEPEPEPEPEKRHGSWWSVITWSVVFVVIFTACAVVAVLLLDGGVSSRVSGAACFSLNDWTWRLWWQWLADTHEFTVRHPRGDGTELRYYAQAECAAMPAAERQRKVYAIYEEKMAAECRTVKQQRGFTDDQLQYIDACREIEAMTGGRTGI